MEANQNTEEDQNTEENEDIISKLSPEDREALELGRKMMKAEIGAKENGHKKTRYRKRPMKIYMALAAVIICVLAMGITSIGGPERVVRMVRQAVGDRDVEQVDSSEQNKMIEGENEEAAYEKIGKELNIEPVKITVGPTGMYFEKMEYDKENQIAEALYKYKKKTIVYFINASYKDSSFGINIDDKKLREYKKTVNDCEILVKEYEVKKDKKYRYTAAFSEKGIEYYIVATMNGEEFEKILDNLFFP